LSRRLEDITILDVYRSLDESTFFAIGTATDHPSCPVEQSVLTTVDAILNDAETLVLSSCGSTALADLARPISGQDSRQLPFRQRRHR